MPVLADIVDEDPTRITLSTEFQHRELTTTLPGAKWSSKDKVWKLPLAWTSCLALRTTFGDALALSPKLTEWAVAEKRDRIEPAMQLRNLASLDVPGAPDTDITRMAQSVGDVMGLYKHQIAGSAFMATAERCLIADETGTGKSAQAIGAVRSLYRMGKDPFPVLVVAPNSVVRPWSREWATWWPGIKVQIVRGGAAERRKALETPAHVYLINWDVLYKHSKLAKFGNKSLKRCIECGGLDERIAPAACEVHKRELNYLQFNTIIADEIHRAKDPNTKQTRALWAAAENARFRFGMTGTPVQDTIEDLWSVLHFIAPDEYSSKSKFMDRMADTGFNIWGAFTVFGIKETMKEEFFGGIDPRMRRMLKAGVLKFLPPVVRATKYVEMPPAQAKAYKQMVKATIAELDSGGTLVASSPLSKATRLLQFSSSYAELEETERKLADGTVKVETRAKLSLPSGKITSFLSDLANGDYGDSSLVVFAQSRQLIMLLSDEMRRKGYEHGLITGAQSTDERQDAIDRFQAGDIKYILVTIAAGGVGLTLTRADTMVFLQRSYSSTAMKQAESRAHRIGSEMHDVVTIVDYIAADTIEEKQVTKLGEKFGRIEAIVRDKEMLKTLLTEDDADFSAVDDSAELTEEEDDI